MQRTQQPQKPNPDSLWQALVRYIVTIEENVSRVLEDITRRPQLDTTLLESVSLLAASTTLVQHKLGKTVRGFKIVKLTASSIVWQDATSTADLTKYLPLSCSNDVTVSLEVF